MLKLVTIVVFVAGSLICSGCGDKTRDRGSSARDQVGPTTENEVSGSPGGDRTTVRERNRGRDTGSGSPESKRHRLDLSKLGRKIRTKGGGAIYPPPRPRGTHTDPADSCEMRRLARRVEKSFPPAPGITAQRTSADTVVVTYRFRSFDRKCLPVALQLTLDVNSDGLPGSGVDVPVNRPTGQVALLVPRRLRKADVAYAYAQTRDGRLGRSSSVLIRRESTYRKHPGVRRRVP